MVDRYLSHPNLVSIHLTVSENMSSTDGRTPDACAMGVALLCKSTKQSEKTFMHLRTLYIFK